MSTATIALDERGFIETCPRCGRRNRLIYERLGHRFRCVDCKTELPPPSTTVGVPSAAVLTALVTHSPWPVLVDFWAPWCGPCQMNAPELEKLARAGSGQWIVAKIDTEIHRDLAARFHIASLPTMVLFFGGREQSRLSGARSASELAQFFHRFVPETRAAVPTWRME